MLVTVIQINSNNKSEDNLKKVLFFLERSLVLHPDIILFPEYTNYMGPLEKAFPQALSNTSVWYKMLSGFAKINKIGIVMGLLLKDKDNKSTSSVVYFDKKGILQSTYHKMHLFDVNIDEKVSFCESTYLNPGQKPGLGMIENIPCGFAMCYDLRFPELFRFLAADNRRIIFLPAAFTETTGKAHWEILVRARAIENQVFIIASNQVGQYGKDKVSYGRSMIVDPWGTILAQAPDSEEKENEVIISTRLDFSFQDHIRKKLPCLSHRRRDLFE